MDSVLKPRPQTSAVLYGSLVGLPTRLYFLGCGWHPSQLLPRSHPGPLLAHLPAPICNLQCVEQPLPTAQRDGKASWEELQGFCLYKDSLLAFGCFAGVGQGPFLKPGEVMPLTAWTYCPAQGQDRVSQGAPFPCPFQRVSPHQGPCPGGKCQCEPRSRQHPGQAVGGRGPELGAECPI